MYSIASQWVYLGTIYLIILTYQDYKRKMLIDDRLNYFMYGVTIGLYALFKRSLWYGLIAIAFIILFNLGLKRFKGLGEGDINTLSWVWLGFIIINLGFLLWFITLFSAINAVYFTLKRAYKYTLPTPYYAAILLSFVCTCALLGLYSV